MFWGAGHTARAETRYGRLQLTIIDGTVQYEQYRKRKE